MLKFYDIDENYIQFLKTIDRQVPDVKYDSNNKFLCGVVLEINGVKYYAPISHKTDNLWQHKKPHYAQSYRTKHHTYRKK